MSNEIIVQNSNSSVQYEQICKMIREDMRDNPYIAETLKVLRVGGYRSAIGSFWNAVVDDLRNKILFRSISMFNKEMNQNIRTYEDFQDNVNDEILIDGAYRIGIIGWEAKKVLKQAKETRHIFDGHPRSSDPGPLKALSMMEDCIKYVLSQDFPSKICSGYFGIKRFDRKNRKKVHMVSVSGLLETNHRLPNLDYNTLMKLTLELTRNYRDVEQLFRLMCFNVFAHNRDDHSKNFSFLFDDTKKEWHLSPAYDLTYSFSFNGEHATTINGEGKNPTLDDIVAVAKNIGLKEKFAKDIAFDIQEKCSNKR